MIKSIDYSELEKAFSALRIKMTVSDFTNFAMQKDFSAEQICSVIETFSLLAKRKEQASINFLLKCSRLSLKNPKTFDNFRFEDIKGRDSERLKSLSTLVALHSHKNLAFIGPTAFCVNPFFCSCFMGNFNFHELIHDPLKHFKHWIFCCYKIQ